MTKYFRVGNRTMTAQEMNFMTPEKIEQIKKDGELANQKRLENMRKSLGMNELKNITLDVTPPAVAARKAAIAAEEARIAAETKVIEEEIGYEAPAAVEEAEAPVETKKSKGKKLA